MFKASVKKIIIFGLALLPNLAFGLEVIYPPIPLAPTITGNNSTLDYIKYYYALFVIVGSIAAFITLVMAGVNMFFSGGEPGKVSTSKNQAMGALIGIVVLFLSYLILNAINEDVTKTGLNSIKCDKDWDVCVEYQKGAEKKYDSSLSDSPNLGLGENDKITIVQYRGLKEVWGFPQENYGGVPTRIGDYENHETMDFNNPLSIALEIGSDIKSIKVYKKMPGIYLYDAANFSSSARSPLFLSASAENLDSNKYKDKIKSIQILNQPGFRYYVVLFAWNNYNKGYDYTFYPSVTPFPNVSEVISEDKTSLPGGLKINSVLLFKSSEGFLAGVADPGITFYNALNCYVPGGINTPEVAGCPVPPIDPNNPFIEREVASVCPGVIGAGQVLSLRVAKQYGVLMLYRGKASGFYDAGYYFDIFEPSVISGNCISDNIFFSKRNASRTNDVSQYIVVPFEEKL